VGVLVCLFVEYGQSYCQLRRGEDKSKVKWNENNCFYKIPGDRFFLYIEYSKSNKCFILYGT
jgi:hypothetical protein